MHWPAPDLFEVAKNYGIFQTASGEVYEGRGSVYFNSQEIGSSKDKARIAIDQDDDLYLAIENATYERIG